MGPLIFGSGAPFVFGPSRFCRTMVTKAPQSRVFDGAGFGAMVRASMDTGFFK